MVIKRGQDFDNDDESDQDQRFTLDYLTIFLVILLILTSELFLYFLSVKTQVSFGFKEIVFGLVSAMSMSLFLIWVRFILVSNKYLGIIIEILGIVAIAYALTKKYQGIYTTTFILIGIVIALTYTIFYLLKSNK